MGHASLVATTLATRTVSKPVRSYPVSRHAGFGDVGPDGLERHLKAHAFSRVSIQALMSAMTLSLSTSARGSW